MKTLLFYTCVLLTLAGRARARLEQNVALSADANAKITVSSCFDSVGTHGFAPLDVTITNYSGQTRQWVFSFSSPGYAFGGMNSVQSTFAVTVENNGTRTAALLVPAHGETTYSNTPLQVRVSGYGAPDNFTEQLGAQPSSGGNPTGFVVISESLGTSLWSTLSARLGARHRQLEGSLVNPSDLPDDWRGLTGVTALWLTADELYHLTPGQGDAVKNWVHAGGRLMICGGTEIPADLRYGGFGAAKIQPAVLYVEDTVDTIADLPTFHPEPLYDYPVSANLGDLKEVVPNVPLLTGFLCLFGFVVGPFNIFFLARKHRERLFWTTPMISLCASGLLVGIIVTQDGAGGHGRRHSVVCVFPQSHNAVVMQEQISRTGLLFNSTFQMRDPVWMEELQLSPAPAQGRTLQIAGNTYKQDWFSSRAVQAQRIVAVEPTRAEITLLNGSDVAKGAAPVMVSSFASTLEKLVYTDAQGKSWEGTDIATGQRATLRPGDDATPSIPVPPGAMYSLFAYSRSPGAFWATSDHGTDFVPTLGSIRWSDKRVTYVGPVTVAP